MSHATIIVALNATKHISDYSIEEIHQMVDFQMKPFDENGECFADGSRWDWYQIGGRWSGKFMGRDIIRRDSLNDEEILAYKKDEAIKCWNKYMDEKIKYDKFIRDYVYGIKENETLDQLIARYQKSKLNAYAFLHNRRWYENGRMGWFGGNAKTECEINHDHVGTCLYENKELEAKIISFNHDEDIWSEKYFDRFIRDLAPETILVNVDYHV